MIIETNTVAPSFRVKDIYGRIVNLEDYQNKRVMLGFFRHAGCPFCNLRIHALSKAHEELKSLGFEMIFFFESKDQVILRSSFHQGVSPIPIIADPEKKWYATYGLESSVMKSTISHITSFVQTALRAKATNVPMHMMADGESFSTLPAEFLLEKGLKIKKLHYSQNLTDRIEIDVIKEFARTGSI